MDYAAMWTMARELSNTNDTDFSDTRLLPFFNQVKNDLFSYMITWISEDRNWDIWTTTSVANQSEYVLPEAASDTEWNLKINWVSVCYDGWTYDDWSLKYIKAREVKLQSLTESWNYYRNNQDKGNPIYYVADKSIFIAPQPETWLALWIELKGIKSILDYETTTTEANIKIPLYLHDVLVQWVLPYIHRAEWRKDEASFELKEYKDQRNLAVKKFSSRTQSPYYAKYPNEFDYYDYEITSDNLN